MTTDFVQMAHDTLSEGEGALETLPGTIIRIIEEAQWKRQDRYGETFTSFSQFVETPIWEGLGIPYRRLIKYCEHHEEANKMVLSEMGMVMTKKETGEAGGRGNKGSYNITTFPKRGTDSTYTLARLKRDRPDLANRVINGGLSANAAAIEAGFRIKTITVPLDINKAVRTLAKHFTLEEIQKAW